MVLEKVKAILAEQFDYEEDKITPEINAQVEDTLNEWFGVEYELIEG